MGGIEMFWASSLVGAGLFFASGWFSARSTGRGRSLADDNDPETDNHAELEHWRERVTNLQTQVAALEGQTKAVRPATPTVPAVATGAVGRPSDADRVAALTAELARLRAGASAAARLPDELERARARLTDLEHELARERKSGEALRDSLHLATAETASPELHARIEQLEARAKAAEMRKSMVEKRVSELEGFAAELPTVQKERDELRRALDRAARPGLPPPPPVLVVGGSTRTGPLSLLSSTPSDGQATVESVLTRHLTTLARERSSKAAVLSDDQGLVLGGTGPEHTQESLAALASLARNLAERAEEFVGVRDVAVVELVNPTGDGLRFRFFAFEDNAILLARLGPGEYRADAGEDHLISAFPRALVGA